MGGTGIRVKGVKGFLVHHVIFNENSFFINDILLQS